MFTVIDVRDGTHDTPSYVTKGYPLITGKDFYNGFFCLSKTQYVSALDYDIIKQRSKVDVGDILFSMIGGNIGSQILITEDNYFEMAIKNVSLFKQYGECFINSKYLSYFLQSRVNDFKSIAAGGAQSFVSLKQLRQYLVPVPCFSEQVRIVSKIEFITPIINRYEKAQKSLDKINRELLDRLKKAILQEAIQGRLVPQGSNDEPASILLVRIKEEKLRLVKAGKLKKKDVVDSTIFKGDDNKYYENIDGIIHDISEEIPYDIPDSWRWARIKSLYKTTSGGTPEKGHPEYYGGEIPWVKVCDLTDIYLNEVSDYITIQGLENSSAKIFPTGTILVAMYCNDAIGKSSILQSPMATNQAICGLFPNSFLHKEYIYFAIQSNRKQLLEQAAGGAQKNINQKTVNELLLPVPPYEEQKRIVKRLFDVLEKMKE